MTKIIYRFYKRSEPKCSFFPLWNFICSIRLRRISRVIHTRHLIFRNCSFETDKKFLLSYCIITTHIYIYILCTSLQTYLVYIYSCAPIYEIKSNYLVLISVMSDNIYAHIIVLFLLYLFYSPFFFFLLFL